MLIDSQLMFSNEQAINSATVISENVIKFGTCNISDLPLFIIVTNDFSNLTNLTVNIETSISQYFSSVTTLASETINLNKLKKGKRFNFKHLTGGNLGYVRLKYVATGTLETTGKISAGVCVANDYSYQDM